MLRLGRAPAKLNLALELTGRRGDGFHLLAAVSQTVAWSDVVGVATSGARWEDSPPRLRVSGPEAGSVPHGEENIVLRTVRLLRARGLALDLSQVALEKRIPSQSGLGGGSADAAALIRLAAPGLGGPELRELALAAGADVPFALEGGAALVGGVGELLSPLPPLLPGLFLVAVLAAIPTAAAYAAVRPEDLSDGSRAAALAEQLRSRRSPDPSLFGSGLTAAAIRVSPGLEERLANLRRASPGLPWAMTGSGGAFFAPVSDPDQAQRAGRALAGACPGIAVRTVLADPG